MKITVNKAKIKKLAKFAKARNNYPYQKIYFQTGRAIVTNGNTVLAIDYKTEPGEVVEPCEVDAAALLELIGAGKEKEILIDIEKMNYNPIFPTFQDVFKEMETAGAVAKIPRMFWALLEPKGAGEFCNLLLMGEQLKAELYKEDEYNKGEYIFCAGCEIEQKNDLAAPLLLYLPEKRIYKPAGKKTEFKLVYSEKRNQYYWKYESEMGTVYTHAIEKGGLLAVKKHYFSDEILTAYQSAIEQMKEQSEPAPEPEPTTIEPIKPTESEESKMQEKKEIEPTEPTTAAESQPEPTSETPTEGGGNSPGWTGKSDYQERREAKIERREERAAELRKEAERLRESVPDDWNYWTQPIHNTAGGRAFARSRQRELNKIDKSFEMDKKADYLESRGQSTAISSDDPEALDKLRAKLQALKENHEKLKAENKRRRQAGEEPFPWYTLQYSNRDIKRIEDRIKELETRQNTEWKVYEFDGGRVIPNVSENRYQIFHDEKPEQSIIDFMKSHGWRWSKYNRCWQRMLNRETVREIESSGKWGYIDYLPGLHEAGAESEPEEPTQEPEQTTEPEPAAMQEGAEVVEPVEESQPEAATVETVESRQLKNVQNIFDGLLNKICTFTLYTYSQEIENGNFFYNYREFEKLQDAAKSICERYETFYKNKWASQTVYLTANRWEIIENPGGTWATVVDVHFNASFDNPGGAENAGEVIITFEAWNIDRWGGGKYYIRKYKIVRNGKEIEHFGKNDFQFPTESKPQQPIEKEEQEKMQDEKKNEQEPTEAGVLPMTDKLKLWGLPLDWERVQVIKHNAQESGLALMVYNIEGDGALFAMLPGFWAIVKERSKFDENSERFIRDNYDGVICYFDKDPEQAETQEEPKAANPPIYTESVKWMEDAKTVSIPAPVVACKVEPVTIPEQEPKPTTDEPDPEQIDKTKPTWTELKYALSLLAMPYTIDTLIEKYLKKTNKPVRYSIVEKLLMTIDRGSVPKPGESKREYIKTYYQTH